jgi:hypothetical protein
VDAAQVTDLAENAAGVLFTVASATFLLRLLRRRASRATNVRLVSERKAEARRGVEAPPPSAASCFVGAVLATVLSLGLWQFSGYLDGLFDEAPPSGASRWKGGVLMRLTHCVVQASMSRPVCPGQYMRCGM